MLDNYLHDPTAQILIAVVAILVIALLVVLFIRSRSRKNTENERMREELVSLERENQFSAAVEQVHYSKEVGPVAAKVADVVREYMRMQVVAIYTGRDGQDVINNILPSGSGAAVTGRLALNTNACTDSLPAALLRQFSKPAYTKFVSFAKPSAFVQPAQPVSQDTGAIFAGAAATEQPGPNAPQPASPGEKDVFVVPWRGSFGWRGLIVSLANEATNPEVVNRHTEGLGRLTDRLAVALEFEAGKMAGSASEERAGRALGFSRALLSAVDDPAPLETITRELANLIGADSAAVWRVDPASAMIRMAASHGLRSGEFLPLPVGQGLAGSVVQTGQVLSIVDAPADPRCLFPREARESGVTAYLGAPILSSDQVTGVLEVHKAEQYQWTAGDQKLMEATAGLVSDLLNTNEKRGNKLQSENAYFGLSEALQRLRSPQDLMTAAVEVLGHALGVSRGLIVEINAKGEPAAVKYEYRDPDVKSAVGVIFGPQLVEAVGNGQPVPVPNSIEGTLIERPMAGELGLKSEMAVPIQAEGKTRAIIYLQQCDRLRQWEPDEVEFTARVARQLSLSLANASALAKAKADTKAAREEGRRAIEGGSRLQGLLHALPESVFGMDSEGRITFFNATARDRLGLGPTDLGGMAESTEALAMADELTWSRVLGLQTAARFEGELRRDATKSTNDAATDNSPLAVIVAATPVRDAKGAISGHLVVISETGGVAGAGGRIRELKQQFAAMEQTLAETRESESQAREAAARAFAAEANVRGEMEEVRHAEATARQEREKMREERSLVQNSAQQLLEINRLKSEFIVNSGHEIEASLQSVLGLAELLQQGHYGVLTREQHEAVSGIYSGARRIKADVDYMVQYGATRSKQLEQTAEG